jgi:hypothetical protein
MEFQNQNQGQGSGGMRPQGSASQIPAGSTILFDSASVGFPWKMLMFSAVLFGFFLLSYLGMKFGYETYLNGQVVAIGKQVTALENQVGQTEQKGFVEFYSQLSNLETVLNRHKFGGNIFSFLEANTLPSVYYTSATFSAGENSVAISGVATTIEDLVQQLSILQSAPNVDRAVLSKMGFTQDKKVNFDVVIGLNDSFFKVAGTQ